MPSRGHAKVHSLSLVPRLISQAFIACMQYESDWEISLGTYYILQAIKAWEISLGTRLTQDPTIGIITCHQSTTLRIDYFELHIPITLGSKYLVIRLFVHDSSTMWLWLYSGYPRYDSPLPMSIPCTFCCWPSEFWLPWLISLDILYLLPVPFSSPPSWYSPPLGLC